MAPERDLALLEFFPFEDMQVATLADSRSLRRNQPVFAVGTPGNRMAAVSFGRIAAPALNRTIRYDRFALGGAIELRMVVEPGHSGGPLFDGHGRLVGLIVGFGLGDTRRVPYVPTRVAYAVPSGSVADYLAEVLGP